MQQEFQMAAKTFRGLEEVLAKELVNLGANNVSIERRAHDRHTTHRADRRGKSGTRKPHSETPGADPVP